MKRKAVPHPKIQISAKQNFRAFAVQSIGPARSDAWGALVEKIINQFCPRFAPGGTLLYVEGADGGRAYCDMDYLRSLGVAVEKQKVLPNVVVHYTRRNWLFLIEAITRHRAVNTNRVTELRALFGRTKVGLVFVTVLFNRRTLSRHLEDVAWGTNVWAADAPDHMIHFNGDRFSRP
ncbi:MAG TPA: BsuBI/PstI family type II restriction endonuclease [Terriglobia bacterium]|nr:BsuBI/PstI family type II restriction endonuclease [Terriglobia bacterium]